MALLIVFHKNPGPAVDQSQELAKKIISCVVIAAACFAFIHWYDKFTGLPVELFQNRHLIWKLAKMILKEICGFLPGRGLGDGAAGGNRGDVLHRLRQDHGKYQHTPAGGRGSAFVLFLTAGLVPWFYFSEALNNGTNALLEYNYLVKK